MSHMTTRQFVEAGEGITALVYKGKEMSSRHPGHAADVYLFYKDAPMMVSTEVVRGLPTPTILTLEESLMISKSDGGIFHSIYLTERFVTLRCSVAGDSDIKSIKGTFDIIDDTLGAQGYWAKVFKGNRASLKAFVEQYDSKYAVSPEEVK